MQQAQKPINPSPQTRGYPEQPTMYKDTQYANNNTYGIATTLEPSLTGNTKSAPFPRSLTYVDSKRTL